MELKILVFSSLLMMGSAFFYTHSRQDLKQQKEIFYREIIPEFQLVTVNRDKDFLPSLEGVYQGIPLKIIPHVNNLIFRGLPRLYLKIYLFRESSLPCHIVKSGKSELSRVPHSAERYRVNLHQENENFTLWLDAPPQELVNYLPLVTQMGKLEDCSEVLINSRFIRATMLVAKGEKGHYLTLRMVKFPKLVINQLEFAATINNLLRLAKEADNIGYPI